MMYYILLSSGLTAILVFICLRQKIKANHQKLVIESLQLRNENLSHMYDEIRGVKHDLFNFVQALEGYVKCNDMSGVYSLTDSIYHECKSISNMEVLDPALINNPAVYNLVVNKYEKAMQKEVMMNIEISTDLSDLPVKPYKLCRILGILLDNAIEAAENTNEKIIFVKFFHDNDDKIIYIENSFDQSKVDIDKIFEKGYSSKLNNTEHGLGLWKVKNIVESSCHLELNTYIKKFFTQELRIKETKD